MKRMHLILLGRSKVGFTEEVTLDIRGGQIFYTEGIALTERQST